MRGKAGGLEIAADPDSRACQPRPGRRVAYLFTTFPLLTETPAQRELQCLQDLPVEIDIYSIWGGLGEFGGQPIRRFNKWRAVGLLWLLPFWLARRPQTFLGLARRLARARRPSLLNVGETVLGIAFALCYAGHFRRAAHRPDLIHAAWATLPATAAQLLQDLAGIPFTMGAHAHDVFRHGGDWDLPWKLHKASRIVTSTEFTYRHLLERGADPSKTVCIRRGLVTLPACRPLRRQRDPLRILAVGRLIEKKGYPEQLEVYAALRTAGMSFQARIVGAGPLDLALRQQVEALGLSTLVTLTGALPFFAVLEQFAWADVLLFTGKVARSGDRDGLPNVIPEAMAAGVLVVASAVAGVSEAVEDGRTGVLISESGTEPWIVALRRLQVDHGYGERLREGARSWVEANYDARRNARRLLDQFEAVSVASAAVRGVSSGKSAARPGRPAQTDKRPHRRSVLPRQSR